MFLTASVGFENAYCRCWRSFKYGILEVQRHCLETIFHLPVEEWYENRAYSFFVLFMFGWIRLIKVQVSRHYCFVVFLHSLSQQELQFYSRIMTGNMEDDWKEKMWASARGRFDEAYQRASSVYVPAFPCHLFFLSLHFVGNFRVYTSHHIHGNLIEFFYLFILFVA